MELMFGVVSGCDGIADNIIIFISTIVPIQYYYTSVISIFSNYFNK